MKCLPQLDCPCGSNPWHVSRNLWGPAEWWNNPLFGPIMQWKPGTIPTNIHEGGCLLLCKGFGDRALELIKTQCTNVSNMDKHHFHKAFTSLAILHEESATHFLQWFTIGRQQAEFANNVYSEVELMDCCITGLQGSTKTHYMLAVQMFHTKRKGNMPVMLREIEKWFNGLDETLTTATRTTVKGWSFQQWRLPSSSNKSNNFKARSAPASNKTTHDFSNYTCYNCNEKGHIASDCPELHHNKNNNNKNGTSACRSNNNIDRKAPGAKRGMARGRSAAATSNTAGLPENGPANRHDQSPAGSKLDKTNGHIQYWGFGWTCLYGTCRTCLCLQ
jgi:hypothetical protein